MLDVERDTSNWNIMAKGDAPCPARGGREPSIRRHQAGKHGRGEGAGRPGGNAPEHAGHERHDHRAVEQHHVRPGEPGAHGLRRPEARIGAQHGQRPPEDGQKTGKAKDQRGARDGLEHGLQIGFAAPDWQDRIGGGAHFVMRPPGRRVASAIPRVLTAARASSPLPECLRFQVGENLLGITCRL